MLFSSIDVFCHVVDNFGDIGFVYRFAKEFRIRHPSCRVRVFCDDLAPLFLMLPAAGEHKPILEIDGITYIDSGRSMDDIHINQFGPADVVIEAFGCDIHMNYLQKLLPHSMLWVNLEHLSAEPWVDGYHLKPSITTGSAVKKYFFMPGFRETTGGVLIDSQVERARPGLLKNRLDYLNGVLENFRIRSENLEGSLFGTVFSYVRGFDTLLKELQSVGKDVYLFALGNKSHIALSEAMNRAGGTLERDGHYLKKQVHVLLMPFLPQDQFDSLLCVADFNFVRGEDSLVRAILAGKPFVWSAYLQREKYHRVKIGAFLDVFKSYFDDDIVFNHYRDLMVRFNDTERESSVQETMEHYQEFFKNFLKIERATREMSYFMTRKCNLIEKFSNFLSEI